eukprot:m.104839 g.104839  ORF g.104839 m.104839 type:complete len:154 (-) comp12646_c0_seq4:1233-1694(-)
MGGIGVFALIPVRNNLCPFMSNLLNPCVTRCCVWMNFQDAFEMALKSEGKAPLLVYFKMMQAQKLKVEQSVVTHNPHTTGDDSDDDDEDEDELVDDADEEENDEGEELPKKKAKKKQTMVTKKGKVDEEDDEEVVAEDDDNDDVDNKLGWMFE